MCASMPGYAEVFDWHSDQKVLRYVWPEGSNMLTYRIFLCTTTLT